MMRKLAIVLLAAVACARPQPMVTHPDAVAATAGRKLFEQHCAACHGIDATGTRRAPSLQSADLQATDAEWIFHFITNGDLRNGMPSWSRLPEERRWQIVAYIKSLPSRRGSSS
jgi:mono/diheme cytochrome c family protein